MIELACNYNPEATINDASCDFTSCLSFGCSDPSACNFNVDFNDGFLVPPSQPSFDCDGNLSPTRMATEFATKTKRQVVQLSLPATTTNL